MMERVARIMRLSENNDGADDVVVDGEGRGETDEQVQVFGETITVR